MAQNHTWLKPYDLRAGTTAGARSWTVDDSITRPYEATWYVLTKVPPDSDVRVVLSKCAVDFTLLCFTDLRKKAEELLAHAASAPPPPTQQAVQAGDASAEDMDSEDMDSEDMDSEDMDSEDMDSEDMDSEDMDSEDMDSGDVGEPDPTDLNKFAAVYAAAQRRSLRAASVTRGVADEIIFVSTRDYSGDLYFRVRGHEGAYASAPFTLTATVAPSLTCEGAPLTQAHATPPLASGKRTLILTHSGRLDLGATSWTWSMPPWPSTEPMMDALRGLANTTDGILIDLASDKALEDVYRAWDAFPRCVAQANAVVGSIRALIEDVAKTNPLEYVVIAGPDRAIPFARIVDRAEISRESRWSGHYNDNTPLGASIAQGFFLSDNPYGTVQPIDRLGVPLYVPTRAVGRLVETAKDIEDHVRWYLAAPRSIEVKTALVSGYTFVQDLADALEKRLRSAGVTAVDKLTTPKWTAEDLRRKLTR